MKVLKQGLGRQDFQWANEANDAFVDLKKCLCALPKSVVLKEGDQLFLYLAIAKAAVSSVIMVDKDGAQILIYYVSHFMKDYEERYTALEKLALALVYTSRHI